MFRGGIVRKRGLGEKSAAGTLGLFEWRMRADVFQSFPRRKFRQSASDPPRTDADCRRINLVRRVRGGFRVGNFYSAKNKICRIPRRRQSDPLAPIQTQADSIGVRRGIVPPPRLPADAVVDFFWRTVRQLMADLIGSDRIRSDPPRTKSADYSPKILLIGKSVPILWSKMRNFFRKAAET